MFYLGDTLVNYGVFPIKLKIHILRSKMILKKMNMHNCIIPEIQKAHWKVQKNYTTYETCHILMGYSTKQTVNIFQSNTALK